MTGLSQKLLMRNCSLNGDAFSKAEAAVLELGFKQADPEAPAKIDSVRSSVAP
jgi:hypothetical protein